MARVTIKALQGWMEGKVLANLPRKRKGATGVVNFNLSLEV